MKKVIKAAVVAAVAVALCIVAGLHMQEVSEVAEARGELAPKNSEYSLALDMSQRRDSSRASSARTRRASTRTHLTGACGLTMRSCVRWATQTMI